ncbi:protein of unknown function [Streptomyces sp. KY75]|nr:protein of unknown function [Streptomyces sp. KY75]CAD5986720.1 protein of unknown function [Streptomyces sp. KY70]
MPWVTPLYNVLVNSKPSHVNRAARVPHTWRDNSTKTCSWKPSGLEGLDIGAAVSGSGPANAAADAAGAAVLHYRRRPPQRLAAGGVLVWWARTVSNRRHLLCKSSALPLSYAPVDEATAYMGRAPCS